MAPVRYRHHRHHHHRHMGNSMRKYATTFILWASLLINEFHTLFSNSKMINVTGGQVTEQWYVYLLCCCFNGLMFYAAWFSYQENKVNRTSRAVYVIFVSIDMIMFFINFKQRDYESIYTFLLISWPIVYNQWYEPLFKKLKKYFNATKDRKGDIIAR